MIVYGFRVRTGFCPSGTLAVGGGMLAAGATGDKGVDVEVGTGTAVGNVKYGKIIYQHISAK